MSNPAVSVILPVLNGERFLSQALESIFQQKYDPLEVIVVDGQSTDRSAAIAQSFEGVRLIPQRGDGVAAARNTGIEASSASLIAFHASDDIWTPDKLRVQVGYMQEHPEVDYSVAHMINFLEPGYPAPPGFKMEQLDIPIVSRTLETLVVRRSAFDVVGLFTTELALAQDVDWFLHAKDCGLTMAILPEVLLLRRIHDRNDTFTKDMNSDLLKALHNSVRRQRDTPSSSS